MMQKLIVALLIIIGVIATLGFTPDADAATTALCVGCTINSQFEAAAWGAYGTGYTQGVTILVINPDTGLSKSVQLVHLPPGVGVNIATPISGSTSQSVVKLGAATTIKSNSLIYIAGDKSQQPQAFTSSGTGVQNADAFDVSSAQQISINTAIALTKQTYFVQLDPSVFPSYTGSLDVAIAMQNFTSLSQVPGLNWPESSFSSAWFNGLLKLLGNYTGHSFVVCDVFGNGDSACFVPDPITNNVLVQSGPAKNANGQQLTPITNLVAGGGGDGMGVHLNPPSEIEYSPPSSDGNIVCGYVNGELSICIKAE